MTQPPIPSPDDPRRSWICVAHPQLSSAQPLPPIPGRGQAGPHSDGALANRPLVRAMVNGEGPFAFLVVPGARRTLIDAELGEVLKIHRSGNAAAEAPVELAFPKHTVKTARSSKTSAATSRNSPLPCGRAACSVSRRLAISW